MQPIDPVHSEALRVILSISRIPATIIDLINDLYSGVKGENIAYIPYRTRRKEDIDPICMVRGLIKHEIG